jgi:hypothetical protein
MMGLDATRLPRGAKFEVKPGKAFMVNGNPAEILYPFKFGETSLNNMATAKDFERMLLQATGTMDSQGMVSQGNRDGAGMSMAVATIIKKYKRTLVNFQEDFLIPFIQKAAFRFMQFDPERYPSWICALSRPPLWASLRESMSSSSLSDCCKPLARIRQCCR